MGNVREGWPDQTNKKEGEVFLGKEMSTGSQLSPTTSEIIDSEIKVLLSMQTMKQLVFLKKMRNFFTIWLICFLNKKLLIRKSLINF